MGDRDRIIEKLKKLAAHAKSAEAIGSEGEAQAFAAKVQQMIAQYNVDRAELEVDEGEEEDRANPIVQQFAEGVRIRKRRVPWLQTLASCIAYGHFCEILISLHRSAIWFVGRKVQADMAVEMYKQLVDLAESIADKEYVKFFHECRVKGDVSRCRGFRQSFLEGFANRMSHKYYAEMRRIEDEAARQTGALVLFRSERDKVADFIKDQLAWKTKKVKKISSLAAYDTKGRPSLRLAFQRGHEWGIVMGEKKLLGLYPTEESAKDALDDMEDRKDAKSGKDFNPAGHKAGQAYANTVKIEGESRKEIA